MCGGVPRQVFDHDGGPRAQPTAAQHLRDRDGAVQGEGGGDGGKVPDPPGVAAEQVVTAHGERALEAGG